MAICDWPHGERPREKLLAQGAGRLSEAELLAIFFRTGIVGRSAVDLARDVLVHFGGLNALFAAPLAEFRKIKGLGAAKYALLQAVLELARRALKEELAVRNALNSPRAVQEYLRLTLAGLPNEVFYVMFLDAQHRLIAGEELFRGTLTQTSVYPREVVKQALHHNSAAVIFAHNHPSGVAEPSRADELLTQALKSALDLVDIKVLDHLVVAGGGAWSFAEKGRL
ncbi:MAG: DNA repair protein RadC [Betaproteobacteria bacterium]